LETWATEIILLTWEYVHKTWLKRNKTEHDEDGQPEYRKKEKIIEIILGGCQRLERDKGYRNEELEKEKLINIPFFQMIDKNKKNAWKIKKEKERNMLQK
jgi:hypothetical protein